MSSNILKKIWPYRILTRDDDEIKADLQGIMKHFDTLGLAFDVVIFVPNAGQYLYDLFVEISNNSFEIGFITVRRASTECGNNWLKRLVFRRRQLADVMRHVEILLRLIKHRAGISHKRIVQPITDINVSEKRVLVIDDSVDTGTTLSLVKAMLLRDGARSVTTACIANQSISRKVEVDYFVHSHVTLRTKNSRDYYAT